MTPLALQPKANLGARLIWGFVPGWLWGLLLVVLPWLHSKDQPELAAEIETVGTALLLPLLLLLILATAKGQAWQVQRSGSFWGFVGLLLCLVAALLLPWTGLLLALAALLTLLQLALHGNDPFSTGS